MPLSDHEQRLLDEMEKQLHQDPQFASSMRRAETAGRYSSRNIALGLVVAVAGLAVVLVGIAMSQVPIVGIVVGIVGFVAMCAGVYLALARRSTGTGATSGGGERPRQQSSYMAKLEQQWDQRHRGEER